MPDVVSVAIATVGCVTVKVELAPIALFVLGLPRPVKAVTLSPLALALVIPVATLITPVPAVAPVESATVGCVIVNVASVPITVSVCLLRVTPVTTLDKSI